MKKLMMAVLFAAGCLAANAEGDWRETCGKIVCLGGDTGLAGFVKRMAPDYMTGDFAEADRPEKKPFSSNRNGYYDKDLAWHGGYFNDVGAFVEGHEVLTLFGMPYGLGQFIMIPVCLILMYLAIVKGFEPLLLLPIGFGGLLANCPMSGITASAMMHDGVVTFLASGIPVMTGGIVEPGGFLHYFFKFGIDTGVFPIMIFMGVGAMTDFGPLIANPKSALLGGAAQLGIFFALFGALMLGNLAKEIGASVSRIADTMANALINIVTIMLGLSVGSKLACEKFLSGQTLAILALGLCAFCVGMAGGVLMAKLMNVFSSKENKVNPLIGSAGVSAVPMAARVSNKVALEDDPTNFVLMQAMGPNVSGVIGSAVVAGILYTLCR